jgi:putrescine transport system substrate-binding protein
MFRVFIYILWIFVYINSAHSEDHKKLYIYNWAKYISAKSLGEFKKKTDLTVIYDVFDNEEMLDAKLVSGNTGYDIVFPSNGQFLLNQINMNLYNPINRNKLKNYKYLDPKILELLEKTDPNNKYTVPFMWTTTSIGYNANKIKEIDPEAPIDSLELIFNPKYAEKFSKCGIAWFNSPSEMIGLAILYNGNDPDNLNDDTLKAAKDTLQKARKYIRYISSDNYPDDLVNGSICIALGWTGDMVQRSDNSGSNIKYILPREGFFLSIDAMAIPTTSSNVENSYKFIDFLLNPKIAAENSDYSKHIPSNVEAKKFMDKSLLENSVLKPSKKTLSRAYINKMQPIDILKKRNRIWNNVLIGVE